MSKPKQDWDEINARRAERYSKIGYELEQKVCTILKKMQEKGLIDEWRQTVHNLSEDSSGIDFVVEKKNREARFGVTISARSRNEAQARYPVYQFLFPIGTSEERIERRVLELLEKEER